MNKKWQAVILMIMCLILTYAICIQLKTVNNIGTTVSTSSTERELKDQILKMKEKYDNKYIELEKAQQQLENERKSISENNEELMNLEKQIKDANIFLGTTEVKGTGVEIILTDGTETSLTLDPSSLLVHDRTLLKVINELKNAGAEAISINGERIVSVTSIMCDGNVIVVNGNKISSPFVIKAIGLPEQLATLKRAGGIFSVTKGINIDFKKVNSVSIPKYTGIINFKYAKSVS